MTSDRKFLTLALFIVSILVVGRISTCAAIVMIGFVLIVGYAAWLELKNR